MVIGLAVLLQASPAAADVDSVSGKATGVVATGDLGVIPPTPTVGLVADESSPPSASGPFSASAPSVTLPSPFPFNLFSTGPLSVVTSARNVTGENGTGVVEAGALVQNVVLGPNLATATTIASSCTADDAGVRGETLIQGGQLFGAPFPPTPNPAPNTVMPFPGIGTITLNEQMVQSSLQSDGSGASSLVVNAVHARFDGDGGGILPVGRTADIVIGQVTCEMARSDPPPAPTTTVPPTSTTKAPVVTTTTVPRGSLPETGASRSALPLGIVAIALGVGLRSVVRSWRRSSPR